jgi:hypothetical protein
VCDGVFPVGKKSFPLFAYFKKDNYVFYSSSSSRGGKKVEIVENRFIQGKNAHFFWWNARWKAVESFTARQRFTPFDKMGEKREAVSGIKKGKYRGIRQSAKIWQLWKKREEDWRDKTGDFAVFHHSPPFDTGESFFENGGRFSPAFPPLYDLIRS